MPSLEPGVHHSHQGAAFLTTRWSVITMAAGEDSRDSAQALEALCRVYWAPLYAYVRRRGHERSDAQDLTQSFFARFLEKGYVARADRDKGRFRTFLLASLGHFLANEWDRANTLKRGGGVTFIAWDDSNGEETAQLNSHLAPDRLFEREWALTVIQQVFSRLQDECVAAGKGELFETLRVHLSGEQSTTSYADAAAKLGMTAGAVQVAVHRLRRRYGELLRAEITSTVRGPEEVDDELRHLLTALRS